MVARDWYAEMLKYLFNVKSNDKRQMYTEIYSKIFNYKEDLGARRKRTNIQSIEDIFNTENLMLMNENFSKRMLHDELLFRAADTQLFNYFPGRGDLPMLIHSIKMDQIGSNGRK